MAEAKTNLAVEKRVMVAVDESESSYRALIWVLENLKESIAESPLFILTVQIPPPNNLAYGACASVAFVRSYCPVTSNPELANSFRENDKKLKCALLERAKDICAERGVAAVSLIEIGDPGTAICDAVKKFNIDLLVLGDRGLGKIKRECEQLLRS